MTNLKMVLLSNGQTIMGELEHSEKQWRFIKNVVSLNPNGQGGIVFGDSLSLANGDLLMLNMNLVIYHYEPKDVIKMKYREALKQISAQRAGITLAK